MPKELERDLGLYAVLAISVGAMVGSGIFILPALAVDIAGPAVILAYVVAGVLVLPAALSKSEMATAMPEAGGTYLFIERGMGPLLGTVAGIGTWFALSFKGALALVGGVPYLLLLFDVPPSVTTPVALALATLLVVVNLLGAKQTGRLQVGIVVVMLAALVWFVLGGVPALRGSNYTPFLRGGIGGLLEATGLVFVSYAGVTKVASVAEEVSDPDRNIPIGILGSLAFTTVLYALIVTVMLGVADPASIADSATPVAVAAEATLGTAGVAAVVLAAILALVSTANAGILSSSRYPFAMARDDLVPDLMASISDRFGTPSNSITLTGVVLLLLIAFVPLLEIAKLASAFQILVFVLINLAVVAFREGSAAYEPSFTAPLYPWIQIFGVVSGVVLLTQMGTVPLVGAVVLIAAGIGWFGVYGRDRVDREGAAVDAVRRQVGRNAVDRTRETIDESKRDYRVLVALDHEVTKAEERAFVRVAADVARANDGEVVVARFEQVPDQVSLTYASETESPADVQFEAQTSELDAEFEVPVSSGTIVCHDVRHAVVNYADHEDADVLLMEEAAPASGLRGLLFGSDVEWVLRHAPCDVALLNAGANGLGEFEVVGVLSDEGPYDPTKIAVADALAAAAGGSITLAYAGRPDASDIEEKTLEDYHAAVAALCSVPVESCVPFGTASGAGSARGLETADLIVVSASERTNDAIAAYLTGTDRPVLVVHEQESELRGRIARTVQRRLF
ncbi:universal stress protein [Halobellus limi]|uniref:Amino acid transporter n=1 Tax=Halobellus limi TaxID=699433 RepID=A0A1H5YR51_9EURY|nr:universal stress protein [Halobellus limi]QCC48379.1 amino acid transporter [Halobellus limi]SEG25997.1 Amino acid transporter [Halobellus limi]